MEIETVMNDIAASVKPGRRACRGGQEEPGRGRHRGNRLRAAVRARIRTLSGIVPGSLAFKADQRSLQPPSQTTDVVSVIKGVIEAELGAIKHYNALIKASSDGGFRQGGSA